MVRNVPILRVVYIRCAVRISVSAPSCYLDRRDMTGASDTRFGPDPRVKVNVEANARADISPLQQARLQPPHFRAELESRHLAWQQVVG
jgi:hypothetical protein